MAKDVILPALGMSQESGKIVQWLKAEGTSVVKGEPLVEIETDKATVEIEAPADGVLARISAAAGSDVPVGQVIAIILPPDKAGALHSGNEVQAITPRLVMASPKARRLAREQGQDLATMEGSGPQGAILAADVLAAREQALLSAGGPANAHSQAQLPAIQLNEANEQSLSHIWRVMIERTTQSWTATPHFYLIREVNASRLIAWRAQALKRGAEKVTYTDLLVRVAAAALRMHRHMNASWNNGKLYLKQAIHVGIAVALEEGLVVPVIHRADTLSLGEIVRQRVELVARAREGKLRPQDISDGTFTISNLGMYNVDAFSAIINQPQAAILAVGRIVERVVPINGQPAVQPMMTLTLSCDHRAVDGARGAQFLDTLANFLEEPLGLLD